MRINPKFLLVLFVFFSLSSKAGQDSTALWKYRIGAKFSLDKNVCFVFDPKYYLSNGAGLQVQFRINQSAWSFQAGINKSEVNSNEANARFHFLNMPLNMRVDKFGFYLSGGLFMNHLYAIKNTSMDASYFKPGLGLNHMFGYETKVNGAFSLFIEARHMVEFAFWRYQTGFSSYGISCGLNYSVR